MALAVIGALDFAVITDKLVSWLQTCVDSSPVWNPQGLNPPPGKDFQVYVTGSSPDLVRKKSDCQVTFYLYHASQDRYLMNSLPNGLPPNPSTFEIPRKPLALDLYYLLSAFDESSTAHEQKAMSMAIRCLYENPTQEFDVVLPGGIGRQELSITMEPDNLDELGRFWQATTVPFRLSAVYRAAVVILTPQADTTPPPGLVTQVDAVALAGGAAVLNGTVSTLSFVGPESTVGNPVHHRSRITPAAVAPGQVFTVLGIGLRIKPPSRVYLISGPAETDITGWIVGPDDPTGLRLNLQLPAAFGGPIPQPGTYAVRVGQDVAAPGGSTMRLRSNSTPFTIVPLVTNLAVPPILNPDGAGTYTVDGIGFGPAPNVLLGQSPLGPGPLGPGTFTVNPGGTVIQFQRPPGVHGLQAVRIQANQVEAAPAWWVNLP